MFRSYHADHTITGDRPNEVTVNRGSTVVVTITLQDTLLRYLHDNHPGIICMKALARSYFWWIVPDKDIEALVKNL